MTALQSFPGSKATLTAALPARRKQTLLVFHVGTQAYALPLSAVQEVLAMPMLSQPLGMPLLLAGFLNLAGTIIPVVRLDRLFELATFPLGRYTPLLLLRHSDCPLAFMVERVSGIIAVDDQDVLPVRENQSFNDCVEGVIARDDHVILLLSAERLLLEKEQQCLAEFQDREQARLRALEGTGP
jgi:purine-binding chemotaxis protein CheW